jgi:hypothetical protein
MNFGVVILMPRKNKKDIKNVKYGIEKSKVTESSSEGKYSKCMLIYVEFEVKIKQKKRKGKEKAEVWSDKGK